MGDSNRKQLTDNDDLTVFETPRGEKGSKIAQNTHSSTTQAFPKRILPNPLQEKSYDVWLHPSAKISSNSVSNGSVLLTTQNSGSNEGHVEVHPIDSLESSGFIQEIRFQTQKLQDSTDPGNCLCFDNTQEKEAGVTRGTMQAVFANSNPPNTPPKWFLEYMEAFKRDLLDKSVSRLHKIEEKLENIVATLATNPVLTASTEENEIEDANVSAENQNLVGCFSSVNTDGPIELQKSPAPLDISLHSSAEILPDSGNCGVTASPRKNLNEPFVASEIFLDITVPEISNVEDQGILLTAEPRNLNTKTMTTGNSASGSKETSGSGGEHSRTPIMCPHGCETADLIEEDIEAHTKESCPALTVNCNFEKVECELKGTQYIVQKHQEESTSHHLGLMCSFAERQQQELAKLQCQIEVQTKAKKNSGMLIRVAESLPLCRDECYLDGLKDDQKDRLSKHLQSRFGPSKDGYTRFNPWDPKQHVFGGEYHVCFIRALEFVPFLKKEYRAKIINIDSWYNESPMPGRGQEFDQRRRAVILTLEVDEI